MLKRKYPLQVIGICLLSLTTATLLHAGTPYCNDVGHTTRIAGVEDYRGYELHHLSQAENTSMATKTRYRYCIDNTHAYSPVFVLWNDRSNNDYVFKRPIPQQSKRPQFHESFELPNPQMMSLKYGPRENEWDADIDRNTIYHREAFDLYILQAQFTESVTAENVPQILADPEAAREMLRQFGRLDLFSGAVIDIPLTIEGAQYLTEEIDEVEQIQFATVSISFQSTLSLRDEELTIENEGKFEVVGTDPVDWSSYDGVSMASIALGEESQRLFEEIEMLDDTPFDTTEKAAGWFFATESAENGVMEARAIFEIVSPKGIPYGTIPVSVFTSAR